MFVMTFGLALVGLLSVQSAVAEPNLSGEWKLASATTNRTRTGGPGPTSTHLAELSAFNCGRECRIIHKGSTLTIDNAFLRPGAKSPSPTVTIVVNGKQHAVVDSVNIGNTINTVGRWEKDTLVLTSMIVGVPTNQLISLEKDQLVVVRLYVTSDTRLVLRYTRK